MAVSIKELREWNSKILDLVHEFGLNCYPQEFEICDHNEMIGYMAYSGMPSRYPHWSFGKNYEKQKTLYEYGVAGLPYEMVINSNPCIAYLMRDNSLLLQILTIAHVYGHNDFFANNFTFTSGTRAEYTIEMFKNHAERIKSYIEDPSIGLELVESALDDAHALSFQCTRNLAIKKLSLEEQRKRAWEESTVKDDPYEDIHPKKPFTPPDLLKIPLEPEEDILSFIAEYHPTMPEWKRDILLIVAKEAKYFIPQIETKIMNEGWASYWHHTIIQRLNLPPKLHLEFIVRHNQVLRPTPGGLNPYHLGFVLWRHIEDEWDRKGGLDISEDEEKRTLERCNNVDTPGKRKIFEVRESDRDTSFIRRFLTPEIMRELDLFQHEKRGRDRIITKVSDEDNWQEIKNTLISNIGTNSIPVIKIEDMDYRGERTLYLKHYHDGRDLQLEYAEKTLQHVKNLWEKNVLLETVINGATSILEPTDDGLKIHKKSNKKDDKNDDKSQ